MSEPLKTVSLDPAGIGAPRLAPSTLGEILDRTVQLYRTRFLLYLGISLVPSVLVVVPLVVFFLLLASFGLFAPTPATPPTAGIVVILVFAVLGLLAAPVLLGAMALSSAAMNYAVSRAYLGERTTIRDAYKTVLRQGWRYTFLLFLEGLIVYAAPIAVWTALIAISAVGAAVGQSAGLNSLTSGALFALAIFLVITGLAAYVVWMLLRLCLAFPACVVEQIPATAALKRSSALSKGTKGRIFLLYILGLALNWLVSIGITVPLTIVMAQIPDSGSAKHAAAAGTATILIIYGTGFIVQALIKPIYGIALTLFYYDQRIRQEGFDIEWMMQRAGMVVPPVTASEAQQPIPVQPSTQIPSPAEGEVK